MVVLLIEIMKIMQIGQIQLQKCILELQGFYRDGGKRDVKKIIPICIHNTHWIFM